MCISFSMSFNTQSEVNLLQILDAFIDNRFAHRVQCNVSENECKKCLKLRA